MRFVVPGQGLGDLPKRTIGDAREYVGEIVLGFEAVELGRLDHGIDRNGPMTTNIGAGEQIILAADPNTAQDGY